MSSVARELEIAYEAHDALEDAKAAANVVLHACTKTGLDISGWLERVEKRIYPQDGNSRESAHRDGNPNGHLFGEVLVFTGSLVIPRQQAAYLAGQAGCNVRTTVNRRTTMLVVGLQDRKRLNGYEKSSKHRKAELLVLDGVDIQILSESDFLRIIN